MTSRRMYSSVGILLLLVVACNGLIYHVAQRSQRRQMLVRLDHLAANTGLIFLGNSLVEAGCDPAAFAAGWPGPEPPPHTINLALGATSPVEHYLILHRALQAPCRPRYLFYGFFDDQLSTRARGDWSELVGNRAFSYYFPEEAAGFYAPGSRLKAWELRLIGDIPMLVDRSSLWGKVEVARLGIEDIGVPKHKINRFGRVDDFSALEAKDLESFNSRCAAVIRAHAGFSPAVQAILRLAREAGMRPILVGMPLPFRHRQIFYSSPAWAEVRMYYQELARQAEAQYLDASDWVKDDTLFEDATHLSPDGAKVFSKELAAAFARIRPGNASPPPPPAIPVQASR